jgi:hypothetical protein
VAVAALAGAGLREPGWMPGRLYSRVIDMPPSAAYGSLPPKELW